MANEKLIDTVGLSEFKTKLETEVLSNYVPTSRTVNGQALSSDVSLTHSNISAGNLTVGNGSYYLNMRNGHDSYDGGIYYSTPGNEAMVFAVQSSVTSFIFKTGLSCTSVSTSWQTLTPDLQIKNGKVAINKLIANGAEGSYNLDVNGTANATTLYENGTSLSSKYQAKLVSGTNIKTINGESILGSGNLVISGGGGEGWNYIGDYDGFSLASPSDQYTASITDTGFKVGRGATDEEDWILEINQDHFEYNVDGANFGYDINNSLFYITSVGGFEYNGNKVITSNDVGGGLTYNTSTKLIVHSNSITAGTIGSSTASSGATLSVPYATYDANGHIKTKGTHTHTINAIKSYASRGSTGGTNRLDYDGLYVFIPYGVGVSQTSGRIGASSSSYTTFYGIAYGYISVADTATQTTYLYFVYRSSATGGWTTKTISWTGFSAYLMNVQVIRIVA